MNRRLTLYLMLCIMALTPWGARATQVRDDVYYKNEKAYIEARQEVIEEKYDVFARCQIDVQQYLDEHPKLLARSIGNVMNTIQNDLYAGIGLSSLTQAQRHGCRQVSCLLQYYVGHERSHTKALGGVW